MPIERRKWGVERLEQTTKDVRRLSGRINLLERYNGLKNLEIKGVPVNINEKVCDVIKQVSGTLSVPVKMQDLDVCHIVPTKRPGQQRIVVQFTNRRKRDEVLYVAKKKRLNTEMIDIPAFLYSWASHHVEQDDPKWSNQSQNKQVVEVCGDEKRKSAL